jgi:hypothetical protein
VLALSLDQATNLALIVATVLVVGAVAVFWVMKTVVQKLVVAVLLALLAFATWSQRASLQECADKVRANLGDGALDDTTCTFFGVDVDAA